MEQNDAKQLNEEKLLKEIVNVFTAAVKIFTQKDYQKASKSFESIIVKYKDSPYYSILEIHARAKVYKNVCDSRLNPVKIALENDEDYLMEGIFNLNCGKYDLALEHFTHLEESKYKEAFVAYLKSLTFLKKEEFETSLEFIGKAIELDPYYKVIAHNEPDFDALFENEEFVALIEP
ncbi:MAG: hypothetical protein GY757_20455 [bacterium]|nr:hypothetical protein [bacterium]